MNIIITNGTIIREQLIPDGVVVVIGNKIMYVGEGDKARRILKIADRSVFEVIDAEGGYIAPGLIDIHVHGGDGVDLMDGSPDAIRTMARYFVKSGTTGFLPSTVTASQEKTRRIAELIATYKPAQNEAEVLGIHLEGPYINEKRKGAQYGPEIRGYDFAELQALWDILGDKLKLVTLAPEIADGLKAVKWLADKGVSVSIGHSDASYEQAVESFAHGVTQATHTYNGMRGLHHREPGVVGAVLASPHIYAQLIPDLVHVHPGAIRVLLGSRDVDRTVLITDAVQATGLPDGEYVLGDHKIFVENGTARLSDGNLAGSTLTMLQAVRNMINVLGVPMPDAFQMASKNAAQSIGLQDKGWIQEGYDADFVLLTPDFEVKKTIINGAVAYSAPK